MNKSTIQFVLATILSVCLMLALILNSDFKFRTNKSDEKDLVLSSNGSICTTPVCYEVAGELIRSIDKTVNPCDDFYQFACGNWMKQNIPENVITEFSPFLLFANNITYEFRDALEKETDSSEKGTSEDKMRLFYKSCMKEGSKPKAMYYFEQYTSILRKLQKNEACLDLVLHYFSQPMALMYLKNHFDFENKEPALRIVSQVKQALLDTIKQISWMDEETKKGAEAKANGMSYYIGYTDRLFNDSLFEEKYRKFNISDDLSLNEIQLNKLFTEQEHFRMDIRRVLRLEPFYVDLENSINIAPVLLRGIYYDRARPNYLNFGTIGSIAGHEISHAFDGNCRQQDKDGKANNWWSEGASRQFKKRSKCLVDQYSKFLEPDTKMHVNGSLTLNENISDNLGFKIAFRGYDNWAKKNGDELLLPGLADFTSRQLFWVSTANVFCTKYTPEFLKYLISANVHSPKRFRINGAFSNLKEFSETFNCPLNSPMNPPNKCMVY